MMTEWQECMRYLHFPSYTIEDENDRRYMGPFNFKMFKNLIGFQTVLVQIARRYLFHTETGEIASGDPCTRIEYARRALLAWCSVYSTSKQEPHVCFPELNAEFPELVNQSGNGWLIRHFRHIVSLVKSDEEELFSEQTRKLVKGLSSGFAAQWMKKVRQMQVPIFQSNTKGAWTLRFDDILAEALDAGPLNTEPVILPSDLQRRLDAAELKGRKREVTEAVLCYFYANRQPNTEWVLFPVCAFGARWGTETFEKKWRSDVPYSLVVSEKICGSLTRARIVEGEMLNKD